MIKLMFWCLYLCLKNRRLRRMREQRNVPDNATVRFTSRKKLLTTQIWLDILEALVSENLLEIFLFTCSFSFISFKIPLLIYNATILTMQIKNQKSMYKDIYKPVVLKVKTFIQKSNTIYNASRGTRLFLSTDLLYH